MTSKIPGWTWAKLPVILNWIISLWSNWRDLVFFWSEKNSPMDLALNGILLTVWIIMVSLNILLTMGVFLADASILQRWIRFTVIVLVSFAIALICIKIEAYQQGLPGLLVESHIGLVIWVGVSLFVIIYFRTGIIEGESTSRGTNSNSNSDGSRDIIV